jgi:hypothetical protein
MGILTGLFVIALVITELQILQVGKGGVEL